MKLLMENWRRFIKENQHDNLEEFGLYIEMAGYGSNIILTRLGDPGQQPFVVGVIETMKPDRPCIPDTHEIGSVAIQPDLLNTGTGAYLYEVAAFHVDEQYQGGISSDHGSSSTIPAARVWNKLDNKLGYIKRKTEPGQEEYNDAGEITGGSDTFDYDYKTPDPNDDCDRPVGGYAATDHSLGIPPERKSAIGALMKTQQENFKEAMAHFYGDYAKVLNQIKADSRQLFNDQYKPNEVGIYQGDLE